MARGIPDVVERESGNLRRREADWKTVEWKKFASFDEIRVVETQGRLEIRRNEKGQKKNRGLFM